MADFLKHKALSREFGRVTLNENDLYRISKIVEDLAAQYEASLDLEIVTGDGEESYKTSSPELLISQEMPPIIRSVRIRYNAYKSPVSCNVNFCSMPPTHAKIEVDGTETKIVAAVFHELERELKSRETTGSRLLFLLENSWLMNLLAVFVYAAISAAAIYSFFDVPLDLILKHNKEFANTNTYKTIVSIGWFCVYFTPWVGAILFSNLLRKSFPPVEFSGKLSDPSLPTRKKMIVFVSFVLIPIIINVISTLLTESLTR